MKRVTNHRIHIVVPARNEESLLPAALRSVREAIDHADRALRLDIAPHPTCLPRVALEFGHLDATLTVVAHRSTDRTAEIGRTWADLVVELPSGSIGEARNSGHPGSLDEITRFAHRHGSLLMTDADSTVPKHWILEHLLHLRDGASIVAGTVKVEEWSDWPPNLRAHYEAEYARDGNHVHGANLASATTAFAQLGGFRKLDSGEDQDLVDRALGLGLRVDWCESAAVTTSARRTARASQGFADYLGELEASGA